MRSLAQNSGLRSEEIALGGAAVGAFGLGLKDYAMKQGPGGRLDPAAPVVDRTVD